ncbi:MAG TPA: ABC transporter substrate-binding protein [Acidimicrobiia bacterium]
MKRTRWFITLLAVLAMVVAACGEDGEGGGDGTTTPTDGGDGTAPAGEEVGAEFALFGAPTGSEGEALQGFIDLYNETTSSSITFRGSTDFENELRIAVDGGNPPEVAATPQPASICDFADRGDLVSLEEMGFDIAEMEANHSEFWMNLGLCEDGNHYGIPWFPNFKSAVFYHQPTFEENGYEVPETYDDLVALSEQMVSDGLTPWCFGYGAGGATGWAGTDWLEDIFVRMHGAEAYSDWFNHEIPFNDPMVVAAFEKYSEILHGEGFVLGGAENVPSIIVEESPGPMFSEPPGCVMLKQGSFAANFFPDAPDFEEGEDEEIGVFAFPTIDGNTGAMGGGDTIIVFESSPETIRAIQDWITPDWQCALASASGGGVSPYGGHGVEGVERLPAHADVDPACLESESGQVFAEAVTTALGEGTFVFDASDLMPPQVGQDSFWQAMIDHAGGTPAQDLADTVEASWPTE